MQRKGTRPLPFPGLLPSLGSNHVVLRIRLLGVEGGCRNPGRGLGKPGRERTKKLESEKELGLQDLRWRSSGPLGTPRVRVRARQMSKPQHSPLFSGRS